MPMLLSLLFFVLYIYPTTVWAPKKKDNILSYFVASICLAQRLNT